MSSVAAPYGATTAMADLDAITDEERLRIMWQQAEDFGERRRIRARMYKLREQRLREMMQNDEESLGTLNVTDDGGVTECSETTITVEGGSDSTRRSSNIQVTMHVDGDSAVTESISTQNVRLGGLTMRGVDTVSLEGLQPDDIIEERIRKASEDRATRFQRIMGELSDSEANSEGEAVVSITKNTYSIQSNALAGGGYLSMKNKEVRDSVSPTRIMRERRSSAEDETSANEGRLISDDEVALKADSENVLQAMQTSTSKTSSSRKTSKEEKTSTRTTRSRQSEIPVRKESSSRRVSERKTSKELDLSSVKRTGGEKTSPTSPTKHTPGESSSRSQMPRRTGAQKEAPTSPAKSPTRTSNKGVPSKKSKLAEIESKMETSIMSELDKLDSYLKASVSDDDDEIIMEEEEDCVDDSGNIVKMLVQTRRKKDGTECTARRVARSTKVVNTESEIDEILIGNPDHEVLERDVAEEEDKEGNKIKIITETRRRPDGITYTTKNILKTSKIFDYDHPEDVAYNEEDELISTDETEETDENGITIQTITETRRKPNGMEYTTKKVYKTSKVKSTQITPSDDDEVIDTKETEEKKDDGSIIRTVIETRRTKTGEEYTHRQVFRSRRMTLSGVDLQKGLPIMQNDDEVINKKGEGGDR
nr:muscle M-line assembly protein unc-89-like isoform X1 [Cherax quadricarinatus]